MNNYMNQLFLLITLFFISYINFSYSQNVKKAEDLCIIFSDGNLRNYQLNARTGETVWWNFALSRSERLRLFEEFFFQISGNELYSFEGDYISIHDICSGNKISYVKCDKCYNRFSSPLFWNNQIIAIGKNIYSYKIDESGILVNDSQKKLMKYDTDLYNDFKIFNDNLFFLNNTNLFKYSLKKDSLEWKTEISSDRRNHIVTNNDDMIIIASGNIIYAINKSNGKIIWNCKSNYFQSYDV